MSEPSHANAVFLDGIAARALTARATLAAGALTIEADDGQLLARWPLDDLRRADPWPRRSALRLCRAGDDVARLSVTDAALRAGIEAAAPSLDRDPHRRPGDLRSLLAWIGSGLALIAMLLLLVIPFGADLLAAAVPPEVEVRMGKAIATRIIAQYSDKVSAPGCAEGEGKIALGRLFTRLQAAADLPGPIELHIAQGKLANAFGMPGNVVIMNGLIQDAASPDELAAFLAHEIAHVERRDSLAKVFQATALGAYLSLISGDLWLTSTTAIAATLIVQSSFSREIERAADRRGLEILAAAGIDGSGLADYFERAAKRPSDASVPALLRSHPMSEDRVAEGRRLQRPGEPAMTASEWASLRTLCVPAKAPN